MNWDDCDKTFRGEGQWGWETLDLSDWSFEDFKDAVKAYYVLGGEGAA